MDLRLLLIVIFLLSIFMLVALINCSVVVKEQSRCVVTRFGKFVRVLPPGLSRMRLFTDEASQPISLQSQEIEVAVRACTSTGSNVTVNTTVIFAVGEDDESVKQAFYDEQRQLRIGVVRAVSSKVSVLSTDELFRNQTTLGRDAKAALAEAVKEYGYVISDLIVSRVDRNGYP